MKLEGCVAEERKARGAFFTPPEISKFLCDWAVRSPTDRLLEPSCGEAAFLVAAAHSLQNAGATPAQISTQLRGQDVHAASVESAAQVLRSRGIGGQLSIGDFFQTTPEPIFDAVVGNPPYVRYQAFSGESRTRALEAALRQGVRLNQLASSWAAFTVHATAFLKPSGRLALVLPAELLTVKYAAQIRRFLLDRFASVRLVLFEDLVFPGVLEEVVLLLAEGRGRAESFEVYQTRNLVGLGNVVPANWVGFKPRSHDKWTGALLPSQAFDLYQETLAGDGFDVMLDWGETYLGAVTGNNDYFTLTRANAKELKLSQKELVPISPPGSKHLRGLTFSEAGWESLAASSERCYLFAPSSKPSRAAERYIEQGESKQVHKAYKCSVREPWWQVPLVPRPDLLFTYMNHDRVRLVRNSAHAHFLNSLYGVRLKATRVELGRELLAIASLNSMTLLGAEIVGRSYGGGLLKHEPREVDGLPIPSFEVVKSVASRLRAIYPQVGALLRGSDITPALDIVDRLILQDHLKLTDVAVRALRDARETLFHRRRTRARTQHGTDR